MLRTFLTYRLDIIISIVPILWVRKLSLAGFTCPRPYI